MMQKVFTDRSRIETEQRCARLRWLEYHEQGMGIVGAKKPLPLAVGGAVHVGLADLLMSASAPGWTGDEGQMRLAEDVAVRQALDDFAQFDRQLALPDGEEVEQQEALRKLAEGKPFGAPELEEKVIETVQQGRALHEEYLYREQSALVEGMVRAYARRRLRVLLEQYEVLEVEREGSWLLSEWDKKELYNIQGLHLEPNSEKWELWFMSRPDALLRERATNELYILSFKTAADWDYRKEKDAQHDMQGLSEGVEVERRLEEWWKLAKITDQEWIAKMNLMPTEIPTAMLTYLRALPAPPRILGIRYEYMLKGSRWTDKDLSAKLGVEVRVQRSPLVRGYVAAGMVAGDEQFNVSWEYLKEGGETSKLYYKNWKSAPLWHYMTTKEWIDKLDAMTMTTAEEGREVGYSGPAQATGYLAEHPLDAIFVSPIVVYRNDDDLRDWVEQVEAQEVRVAESVAQVRVAGDEGEKRSLLNRLFPQTRRACSYPTQCAMIPVCYGGEDARRDPLGTKLYQIRIPNHPVEGQQ